MEGRWVSLGSSRGNRSEYLHALLRSVRWYLASQFADDYHKLARYYQFQFSQFDGVRYRIEQHPYLSAVPLSLSLSSCVSRWLLLERNCSLTGRHYSNSVRRTESAKWLFIGNNRTQLTIQRDNGAHSIRVGGVDIVVGCSARSVRGGAELQVDRGDADRWLGAWTSSYP